jgi:hypothetical protein
MLWLAILIILLTVYGQSLFGMAFPFIAGAIIVALGLLEEHGKT